MSEMRALSKTFSENKIENRGRAKLTTIIFSVSIVKKKEGDLANLKKEQT